MRPALAALAAVAVSVTSCGGAPAPPVTGAPAAPSPAAPPADLRPPSAFAGIADPAARSRALFEEAGRVLTHPRCVNCHPIGDAPHQREAALPHEPPVLRGEGDRGVVAMTCPSCHQDRNLPLARVPGAPGWHLAPRSMAWEGKSLGAICEQLKDPARNGGRTLQQIVEHSAHDPLVAWGFAPGSGRAPAPGPQSRFGELLAAWVLAGSVCPEMEARR